MDASVFTRRRRGLMQLMSEGAAVIPTAPQYIQNGDVHYLFRPDSDFYYLTHFPEPDAVAVLLPEREQGEFVLFCREKNPEREIWEGRHEGLEGAVENYGADDAFPIDDMDEILPGLLENRSKVFCNMGRYHDFDIKLINWVNEVKAKARVGISAPGEFVDLNHILHELRLLKRTEEIRIMTKAARISSAAHCRAMASCQPGKKEYEIQAELEYEFRKGGSRRPAYPPIVAGGANACVLHYIDNDAELNDGDLLLIDAGAEIDCYAADITRTFPVNGKFTDDQKILYEIVLNAQLAAIEQVKPGNKWNDPHDVAVRVLVEGLTDIGLLKGNADDIIDNGDFRDYYMHRTGHWLGMDVHDVGDYRVGDQWRLLEPGMVLTVEPGLYLPAVDKIPARWQNIGIRIEDDVLITRDGHTILSASVPKLPDDIETLMAH